MANHQDNLSVYGSPKNGLAVAMAAWQDGVRVSAVRLKRISTPSILTSTHHLRVQMGGGYSILPR